LHIEFISELFDFEIDNTDILIGWLKESAGKEGKVIDEITFIFVDNIRILEVNQTYLNHNYFTDIITFNNSFLNTISGEIYICIPQVKANAKLYSVKSFNHELYRVILHGILHLIGYHDYSEEEKGEMRKLENFYLEKFNF
jgi:probable rRNA maturation factor